MKNIKYLKTVHNCPVKKLRAKLKLVFNKFIRLRDRDRLCISCGKGSVQQAGHYYPVGSNQLIEFVEQNVHGQCISCNKWGEGATQGYRLGLIKRYGEKYLENLEVTRALAKSMTLFQCEALIIRYTQKVKELGG